MTRRKIFFICSGFYLVVTLSTFLAAMVLASVHDAPGGLVQGGVISLITVLFLPFGGLAARFVGLSGMLGYVAILLNSIAWGAAGVVIFEYVTRRRRL